MLNHFLVLTGWPSVTLTMLTAINTTEEHWNVSTTVDGITTPAPAILPNQPHVRDGASAEGIAGFRTARQIAEESPAEPPWIAKPWVARFSVTEVVGKAKAAGKTTWLLKLVACVLEGLPFMGEPTDKTPVVYLTEERRTTLRKALERAGLLESDDLHFSEWTENRGKPWPEIVKSACKKCAAVGARLLVIDTLPQFAGLTGDKENNAGDALAAYQPLLAAAATGLAIVAVRHEKKSGGTTGDAGRGSTAFTGAADIIIRISKNEKGNPKVREIGTLSRFDETPEEVSIELTDDGYVALGPQANSAAANAARRLTTELPTDADHAVCVDQLEESTGVPRATLQGALASMLDRGKIARLGEGVRGNPYRYWFLSAETPSAETRALAAIDVNDSEDGFAH